MQYGLNITFTTDTADAADDADMLRNVLEHLRTWLPYVVDNVTMVIVPQVAAPEFRCVRCGSTDLWGDAQVCVNDPTDVRTFDAVTCGGCGDTDTLVTSA